MYAEQSDDKIDVTVEDPDPMTTGVSVVAMQPTGKSSQAGGVDAKDKPLADWTTVDVAAWVGKLEEGSFESVASLFENHGVRGFSKSSAHPPTCSVNHPSITSRFFLMKYYKTVEYQGCSVCSHLNTFCFFVGGWHSALRP